MPGIHDAQARAREPLLAAHPGMIVDVAEAQCVRAAVQHAGLQQATARPRPRPGRRPRGPPASAPRPAAPASTCRANRCARCARRRRVRRIRPPVRGHGVGAHRQGAGIARYADRHRHPVVVAPASIMASTQLARARGRAARHRRSSAARRRNYRGNTRPRAWRCRRAGLAEVDAQLATRASSSRHRASTCRPRRDTPAPRSGPAGWPRK